MLVRIDVRPATGELYGLSNQNNIYTINPTTGASSRSARSSPLPDGFVKAIDFNPTVDRIRVLGSNGTGNNNLRVNPANAATLVDARWLSPRAT